eukprot:359751-Chlamydomonas_euryale.AAC.1
MISCPHLERPVRPPPAALPVVRVAQLPARREERVRKRLCRVEVRHAIHGPRAAARVDPRGPRTSKQVHLRRRVRSAGRAPGNHARGPGVDNVGCGQRVGMFG